jgi:hypothetical protein
MKQKISAWQGLSMAVALAVMLVVPGCSTAEPEATSQDSQETRKEEPDQETYRQEDDCRVPQESGVFLSDQEVVKIQVSYNRNGRAKIHMLPPPDEPSVIHFITEGPKPLPGRPIAVRWEVAGLQDGHVLYITPKERSSRKLFDFPDRRGDDPAFAIKGGTRYDTLYSGEAQAEAFKNLYEQAAANFKGSDEDRREAIYVSWFYNIEVFDENGEQVGGIDPETRVKMYP